MNTDKQTAQLSGQRVFLFLTLLIAFGGVFRFMIGYGEVHYFDLNYYVTWANDVFQNGIFGAYTSMADMKFGIDYPPMILFPLYITGAILNIPAVTAFDGYIMLAVKMWQILFDIAVIPALYLIFKNKNKLWALGAAAVWCINPAIIFNSSAWGQTDSILIFLLLLTFGSFYRKKPVLGMFLYAVSCLTKFQAAYFAPVIILVLLFSKYDFITIIKSILAGAATAIAVFLPFMLRSGAALPIQIYFGGLGKWPYAALYSFNFFGGLGLNYVQDSVNVFMSVSAGTLGNIMTLAAVIGTVVAFFTAKRRCPFILAFLLMNTIFMFASRMHERYQLPVIIFLLAAAVVHKSGRLLFAYLLTSVTVFFNQYIAFEEIVNRSSDPAPWMANIDKILINGSIINVIVYFLTLFICLDHLYDFSRFFKSLRKENPIEQQSDSI